MRRFTCAIRGLATGLLLTQLGSCVAIHPLTGDEICAEVGYAIAANTLECAGDRDLANLRYEQFTQQLTCTVVNPALAPVDQYLQCSVAVNAMDCDRHNAFEDDLVSLVAAASPQCSRIFEEIVSVEKPAGWSAPHNGLGPNPMYDTIPGKLGLCPNPVQGSVVDVTVTNNRTQSVVLVPLALPCKELAVERVITAAESVVYTAPTGSVFLIRSNEGSLIVQEGVVDGLVVEVVP